MNLDRAKGTRDFPPEEKILRDKVIDKIKRIYEKYGFSPLDTPTIARYDVMTAKGGMGEDSDAYKETFSLTDNGKRKLGLRFELTFQLARFIGMNPQMKLPFKRYQIGNVFRDGPIKAGRYREFTQCDADIVGSKRQIADAEILALINDVFNELELDVSLDVNNRKLLTEIMTYAGINESLQGSALISIDKLKKIKQDGVRGELEERGISDESITKVFELIDIEGSNEVKLNKIKEKVGECEAVLELEELFSLVKDFNIEISFEPTLARGLGYYTGTVFEVIPNDTSIVNCSLAGGGRWDKMVGKYLGNEKLNFPAVGVGVGLEPIMEIMKSKIGMDKKCTSKIFLIPIGTLSETIKIAQELRSKGVPTAMDLNKKGLSKNLDYANSWKIPYVGIIGENELAENKIQVKNMESGEEKLMTIEEITKL
ncbi:histidine--tRNA ligase [Candidatus Woesearchaeota archaeon]|nr:histidine--tRNA ligase [Candidatus Woesearchaeota archaeon]